MSVVSKGRKLQKAYLKINKKTGRSDRQVVLQTLVAPNPVGYDPDVSNAPDEAALAHQDVYTFPPFGGCILQHIPRYLVLTSNGKYRETDWRLVFPGGLKDSFGAIIPDSVLENVSRVLLGPTGSQDIMEIVSDVSPADKDTVAFGVILEWDCVIRHNHGG